MQKPLKLSASVLFAAGTIALVNASPAQACTGAVNSNLPGATFGAFTLGTSYDAGNGFCFTLHSFGAGFTSDTPLTISTSANAIGWSTTRDSPSGFIGNNNTLNYTFSRFLPDPSNLRLKEYTSSVVSGNIPADDNTGSGTITAASGPSITSNAFVVNVPPKINVSTNPSYIYPNAYLRSETFTASMSVSQGQLNTFQSTTSWVTAPPAPGPLPLLGAGAAFGFSRKLRSRIKLSA